VGGVAMFLLLDPAVKTIPQRHFIAVRWLMHRLMTLRTRREPIHGGSGSASMPRTVR